VNWDTTENLYIEGDNLETLKLLQKSYYKKVKMIYIDPPYNTGKDFVYKDNYIDNMTNYLEISGQDRSLGTNTESDGRYHSNWLNMMYPRLKLARNLLTDNGVIFISIDDNEVANLKKVCDEIFGEENFVGQISVLSNPRGRQSDVHLAAVNDLLLIYSKNSYLAKINGLPLTDPQKNEFSFYDETQDDYYRLLGLRQRGVASKRTDRPEMFFPIYVNPDTLEISFVHKEKWEIVFPRKSDETDGRWMWGKAKCESDIKRLVAKKIERRNEFDIFVKDYLHKEDIERTRKFTTIWNEKRYNNQVGTQEVKALLEGDFMSFPKSKEFLVDICLMGANNESIILDFFSGSATTAHAVMQLNAEDGGNRKYIMIQLPEVTPEDSEAKKAGYKTIAEIGKERIRRAGKKILEELKAKQAKEGGLFPEEQKKLDIGFKVFKLDSSNINTWDSSPSNIEGALYNSVQNIKSDRTEHDLLYEILLKYGIDLVQPINEYVLAGKKVYEMGAGALIVCMADHVKPEAAEAIAQLWKEVKPTAIDESSKAAINCRVVFKDNGFDDNNDKTNVLQILKQHGIDNVVTI